MPTSGASVDQREADRQMARWHLSASEHQTAGEYVRDNLPLPIATRL
jgi:hypothetical protein